jgi:hypothetical protein
MVQTIQLTKEEQRYIDDSFAEWHIKGYLEQGDYSVEDAIIRGMEDYIDELMEELVNLKENPKNHETQTQKGTQNIED